jgi:peptidoglycan/xylan/chitin deacetylase (PgdA/CDA1 family)
MSGRTLRWLMSLARRSGRHGRNGGAAARLTIIRHHRVYADDERPLYRLGVSERVFAEQLGMLVSLGLTPVSAAEGWRRLAERRPGNRVAMTFDDGYADNAGRALRHLLSASAGATFYLTAGLMDERHAPWWDVLAHALEKTRAPRLDWSVGDRRFDLPLESRADRVRALHRLLPALGVAPVERARRLAEIRDRLAVLEAVPCELMDWEAAGALARAGMEVGAHSLDHPLLSLLPADSQRREIAGSIELIERRLGIRPVGFAYPGGDYDAVTLEAAAACGLEYAVTTRPGLNLPGASCHELRRRGLSEGACLGPSGRFSRRLAMAELEGAFDRLRRAEVAS